MPTNPPSISFDDSLWARLRRRASAMNSTPSALAQRLIEEGLRAQEHPGVIFRDGPTGRRAVLVAGPDVWEVVAAIRYSSARGEAAVEAVAREMGLSADQVKTALDYFGRYPDETDAEVAENERAAEEASAAWRAQRRLLA